MVKFDEKLELTRRIDHLRIEIKLKEKLLEKYIIALIDLKGSEKSSVERCVYASMDKENSVNVYKEKPAELPTGASQTK